MRFEWDKEKSAHNMIERGISFELASQIFEDGAHRTLVDNREDYGEVRLLTYGMIGRRLFAVVHTSRGEHIRIISARKANRREQREHERWMKEQENE